MSEKPRVLIVLNDCGYFLSHRLMLARQLSQHGYEVHIATPRSPHQHIVKQSGLVFHELPPMRGTHNPLHELKLLLVLVKLYRTLKPNIVHHVTTKPILYGSIAAKMTRIPAVINAITGLGHLFIDTSFVTNILKIIIKCGYKLALNGDNTRTIFQNPDDQADFIKANLIHESNAILIRGAGVEVNKFVVTDTCNNEKIILLPGRLIKEKGVIEFVGAARLLKLHYPKVRFVLVGSPDPVNPSSIAEKQIKQWQQQGIIEWWGYQQEMKAVYEQSYLVCLPSYREGLPKALLEACAAGRAIVTTDVPGCREVVINGENGFLVTVKSVTSLAHKLETLILNPMLVAEMGRKSRQLVEREFSSQQVFKQIFAVYEALCP